MDLNLWNEILIVCMVIVLVLIAVIAAMQVKIYRYRRRVYFIKRDRERCNELLYTAKDGFFCFVYPDSKVKDPQKSVAEKCSRRLAVMLGLKNGTASTFANILEIFYKDDAQILKKYVTLLQQEGMAFEDMLAIKNRKRYVCVYGSRVHGADNNLYCDIIWFRDISAETAQLSALEEAKISVLENVKQLENMIDGLDTPFWLRDENLNLQIINKKYAEFAGKNSKDEVLKQNIEINNHKGEAVARQLAATAQKTKKKQHKSLSIVRDGQLYNFELHENPYFTGDTLDKIGTVGYLINNTEFEKAKRNFKLNQNNHLEILGVLGTAFAIFDEKTNLYFYNNSFRLMWELDPDFLEKTPSYLQFIETIRQHKLLPPVPDFKAFKEEELSVFNGLWKMREDLLHLPDGRAIHRFRMPHPNGVIFAFEDVSDRLATMRRLNELTSMQQGILDNLTDAVIIFSPNQRLKFYNRAYLKLWSLGYEKMQDEPKLEAIIAQQKLFFSNIDNWESFRQAMMSNIMAGRKFTLLRDDDVNLNVSPQIFYDGSIMLTYSKENTK